MSAVAIRTEGLGKRYGEHVALRGLDLEVCRGEVFGFLGPNGAGKTTTIRLLLDLLRPTEGRAEVLGCNPRSDAVAVHRRTGYLPGELVLDPRMTGAQTLEWFANLRGGVREPVRSALAERLDLDLSRPVGQLSKGNRQKVGLVQAFMHDPELVVLDEPTSGLDPLVQRTVLQMVREVADDGRTVFLSSHLLDEVEQAADRAAIIRAGALVAIEDVAALRTRAVRRITLHFAHPLPGGVFDGVAGVRDADVHGRDVHVTVEGSVDGLFKAAAQHEVVDVSSGDTDLEAVFLGYYRQEGDGAA